MQFNHVVLLYIITVIITLELVHLGQGRFEQVLVQVLEVASILIIYIYYSIYKMKTDTSDYIFLLR